MPASVAPIDQSGSYVFLSHNSKDSSIVQTIAEQLKSGGVNTWIDTEQVSGGEPYEPKIIAAMNQAKANIVFYGTHGLGRWQKREVAYASKLEVENGIHAIVVLLPNANEEEALKSIGFLATKSHIAFKTETDQSAMDRLLNSLKNVINVLPTGSNPTRSSRDLTSELASEKGVDYTRLRDLLKAGQWKEADQETQRRMREVMGIKEVGLIRLSDIETLTYTDLRTIDQLWVKHSQGKFGFSVQKQIWQKWGSPTETKRSHNWDKFGEEVGWKKKGFLGGGEWKVRNEITFDTSAQSGHLPWGIVGESLWLGVGDLGLFSLVKTCRL